MYTEHAPGLPKAHAILEPPKGSRSASRLTAATSTWHPNAAYRFTFKEGMSGWDVWAVQVAMNVRNLGLAEDGQFGPKTKAAAERLQAALHIGVDGIVGPETQRSLCIAEAAAIEKGLTPKGLLKGICLGESGGIIPATSTLYPSGSRDYGPFQDNMLNPSDQELREAFNPKLQAHEVGTQRRSSHDYFLGQPGAVDQEEAWRLAVLSYNWPAAANQIAAGRGDTWVYKYEGHAYKLADAAPWVEAIGVKGITTGWQWCKFYIDTKVVYVTSWTVF